MPLCYLERYEEPIPYTAGLVRQREIAAAVLAGEQTDTLMLLEHTPTITITRSSAADELRTPVDELARRGIEVFETDRGGRSTYHGPGQLVGYPVLDLRRHGQDLHRYLRVIEDALVAALGMLGIDAGPIPGLTGVWVDGRKIAAIGVKARRWVTTHGFSLNVDPDLTPMRSDIVPCGLYGRDVTSVFETLGRAVSRSEVESAVLSALATSFNLEFERSTVADELWSPLTRR